MWFQVIFGLVVFVVVGGLIAVFGYLSLRWNQGVGNDYYDEVEQQFESKCLVCESIVSDTRGGPCPECGFDPESPGDRKIERTLEQFDRLDRISSELEGVLTNEYTTTDVGGLRDRLHELRDFDCIEADDVPNVRPDELIDHAGEGGSSIDGGSGCDRGLFRRDRRRQGDAEAAGS
ncbi:MAG: hypothetical protein ABEL76_02600 [Bradymonadaceae bacterium]